MSCEASFETCLKSWDVSIEDLQIVRQDMLEVRTTDTKSSLHARHFSVVRHVFRSPILRHVLIFVFFLKLDLTCMAWIVSAGLAMSTGIFCIVVDVFLFKTPFFEFHLEKCVEYHNCTASYTNYIDKCTDKYGILDFWRLKKNTKQKESGSLWWHSVYLFCLK